MNLTGIISISGKPGLYKVIAQGKNNIIVESLEDRKRFPAYAADRISALDDISIYTDGADKPLKEIFTSIFEKENGGETISHKEDQLKLKDYLLSVLPNYDQERVYQSDVKKLFQWYNLCHKAGELKIEETVEDSTTSIDSATSATELEEKKGAKKATEKTPAKKVAVVKKAPATPKAASKSTGAKKAVVPKSGGGRGK